MNLYAVRLQGSIEHFDPAYVVASNPSEAYEIVRRWLDKKDWAFSSDRGLKTVELLAETKEYTDLDRLFIAKQPKEAEADE